MKIKLNDAEDLNNKKTIYLSIYIYIYLSTYLSRVQGESKDREKELGCLKIKLNDAEDLNN